MSKQTRIDRRLNTIENLAKLQRTKISYVYHQDCNHAIIRMKNNKLNYYPSTNSWYDVKTRRQHFGTFEELINYIVDNDV